MKQKLLIGTMLCGCLWMMSGSVVVYGQTCTASPSCTELGYTKTQSECGEDGIKCPFGNLWSCSNDCEKYGFTYGCTGTNERPGNVKCGNKYSMCNCAMGYEWKDAECKGDRKCQIGWIYYADNSCSAELIGDKTALGVVVYVNSDGVGGQVMSAWPVDANGNKSNYNINMEWAEDRTTIPYMTSYVTAGSAATDFNSCDNTDKIIAYGGASTYPAAWAARSYAPTTETKGKWCLPAAGVMISIYNNQSAVQAGISKLGGIEYPRCCTWSSTQDSYYDSFAWNSDLGSDGLGSKYTNYSGYVRPVLEF